VQVSFHKIYFIFRFETPRHRADRAHRELSLSPTHCVEPLIMANVTQEIDNLVSPAWLDTGDNAWQLTAASLVALQSVPGLCVLYAGLVKKKWYGSPSCRAT